ncbi:MAG: HdeD family acid-resistance protein [Candidatus Binatia bacterium]
MRIAGTVDIDTLVRNWWVVLLRGIAGIAFAVITFIAPEISLTALVLVFGAYALIDGVLMIITAIRRRGGAARWWMLLLAGLAGVGIAAITVLSPRITALALVYLVALWALVTGGLEIAAAVRLRKVIRGEWLLVLSGVAAVALGVLLMLFPDAGAIALVLWIGAYAFVTGVLLVALGLRLRSWAKARSQPGGYGSRLTMPTPQHG